VDYRTRLALMTEALETMAASHRDGDFVIFNDLQTNDYVQFMVVPFLQEPVVRHVSLPLTADWSVPKVQWEVTDRGLHRSGPVPGMPPLGPAQVAAINDAGFVLNNQPNFRVYIDLTQLDAIAQECEHLFDILGSSPNFELSITIGG
jgi:hypothetical protein